MQKYRFGYTFCVSSVSADGESEFCQPKTFRAWKPDRNKANATKTNAYRKQQELKNGIGDI
ncbi:MAG: hypothetical protein AYP45_12775 [Candidatus Brocadia carolinensis]|uniref:Uncharacterized protein n=1 Tax=Candidatus Brocadia carolinensis TaxID=1004156 RepID=A0A1V4ARK4_9BACT|nr:MAG: hypothetical protein AYP45_12775 [Candidatus Brocadia caroliniensis]